MCADFILTFPSEFTTVCMCVITWHMRAIRIYGTLKEKDLCINRYTVAVLYNVRAAVRIQKDGIRGREEISVSHRRETFTDIILLRASRL